LPAHHLSLELPEAVLDQLARRVVELIGDTSQSESGSPWLSAREAAEYLRWPLKRIYNLTAARAIPHHRQGGRLVFNREELDRWLGDNYHGPLALAS
jgi:excisionase family DNA binding protein